MRRARGAFYKNDHAELALELWDHLLVGVGAGAYAPQDRRPTSESVIDCTSINGQVIESTCGEPHSEDSTVGAGFGLAEVGYQVRFRPAVGVSVAPGISAGYLLSAKPTRSVSCDGCRDETLDVDVSGGYLAPSLRLTFGSPGLLGIELRSEGFYFTDLQQMTVIAFEGRAAVGVGVYESQVVREAVLELSAKLLTGRAGRVPDLRTLGVAFTLGSLQSDATSRERDRAGLDLGC